MDFSQVKFNPSSYNPSLFANVPDFAGKYAPLLGSTGSSNLPNAMPSSQDILGSKDPFGSALAYRILYQNTPEYRQQALQEIGRAHV